MTTPYIGYSNETLSKCPTVSVGDEIKCTCGQMHLLEESKTNTGSANQSLYFYRCGDGYFLGAINRKLIIGVKSDVSGTL